VTTPPEESTTVPPILPYTACALSRPAVRPQMITNPNARTNPPRLRLQLRSRLDFREKAALQLPPEHFCSARKSVTFAERGHTFGITSTSIPLSLEPPLRVCTPTLFRDHARQSAYSASRTNAPSCLPGLSVRWKLSLWPTCFHELVHLSIWPGSLCQAQFFAVP
jgi:hypothetical protein